MNSMNFEIIMPALLAGMIVLSTHIPLGRIVLKRGIIFIDLAIAQVAGLGILLANYAGFDAHNWELQIIAFASALLGAAILKFGESVFQEHQEAFIGIVFVLSASLGILILAKNPHGGEHLKELLVGQILWVDYMQLIFPALVSVCLLVVFSSYREAFERSWFYFAFAIAITLSVQLLGVYLVFASLILPALGFYRLKARQAYLYGFVAATFAFFVGLLLSALFDLPSGALIVWMLACMSFLGGMAVRFIASAIDAKSSKNVQDLR